MPETMATIFGAIGKWMAWHWVCARYRRMTSHPIFFPDRKVLDRESPLADKMERTVRIDAIWLTGIKSIVEIESVSNVDRLLLPDPGSNSLKYFQSTLDDVHDLSGEIRRASKQAKTKGIQVRWLSEFVGYSLMIGNPKSKNAWVHIEMALPVLHGARHPSFEFRKPKHTSTVDDIIKMFDSLWENDSLSREPKDKDFDNG